jgi:hypothetical protein
MKDPPKDSSRKLLDLIRIFSKAAEYKIIIHKSVAFPYTSNNVPEKEVRKMIMFTIVSKYT